MVTAKKERESNIELLRIFLMISLVMLHSIAHGGHIVTVEMLPKNFATYQKVFWQSLILYPVDCFVYISGYFGIKTNLRKVTGFYLTGWFYSVVIMFVVFLLAVEPITIKFIGKSLLPVLSNQWWFFSAFLFVMLFSPAFNIIVKNVDEKTFRYLLIVGGILITVMGFIKPAPTLINHGASISTLAYIYMLGRYMRLYRDYLTGRIKVWSVIFIITSFFLTAGSLLLLKYNNGNWILEYFHVNNPFMIFNAVALFYLFKKRKFKNEVINKVAMLVFPVYLIHDHIVVRNNIYHSFFNVEKYSDSFLFIFYLIFIGIILFLFSITIEKLRTLIFNPLEKSIFNTKIFQTIEKYYPVEK